jgi:hypothetical protein
MWQVGWSTLGSRYVERTASFSWRIILRSKRRPQLVVTVDEPKIGEGDRGSTPW